MLYLQLLSLFSLSAYHGAPSTYINLFNSNQASCQASNCPATFTYLNGTPFNNIAWFETPSSMLNVGTNNPCIQMKYNANDPPQITKTACASWFKYICELDCDFGISVSKMQISTIGHNL